MITNVMRNGKRKAIIKKTGVTNIKYWVKGYIEEEVQVFNMDYDTIEEAIESAKEYINR